MSLSVFNTSKCFDGENLNANQLKGINNCILGKINVSQIINFVKIFD